MCLTPRNTAERPSTPLVTKSLSPKVKSALHFVSPSVTIDGDCYFDEIILNFVTADVVNSMRYLCLDLLLIMKAMIATRDPKNREELREVIQQVWRDLKIETINALVAELPTPERRNWTRGKDPPAFVTKTINVRKRYTVPSSFDKA
jgi:hypothetical protein